ncbi:MAG: hypothetical protein AB7U75_02815 [Hyphomicrobiaceae bacterium]
MDIAQFIPRICIGQALPAAVVGAGLLAAAGPAAAIDCQDQYQVVQGQLLATPYCQDNYLAKVAREYGVKVSDETIRNNPNKKAEVCRFMGFDTRVSQICDQYRDFGPGFAR